VEHNPEVMPAMPGPFLLAAPEIGQLIGIAFLVLSILSYFVSAVNGARNAGKGNAAPQPRPPKPDARTELQDFLAELLKPKAPEPPPAPKPRPEKPRPPKAKSSSGSGGRQGPPGGGKPSKADPGRRARQGSEDQPSRRVAEQHLMTTVQPSSLGSGVAQHVQEHLAAGRVSGEAQAVAGQRIADAVRQDLGGGIAAIVTPPPGAARPQHPLAALLRTPQGAQQAILLQEIMQRPVSLRR
jgi:hypothetical protein